MDNLKSILKSGIYLQPILTIVLVILLILLIFQFFGGNLQPTAGTVEKQIGGAVSFESATQKFYSGRYDVYTRGSLYIKDKTQTDIAPAASTPTPAVTTVSLIENKYDDMIFLVDNASVKKIDVRAYGQSQSLLFNSKGEILFINNTASQYTLYPLPDDSETDAKKLFDGTRDVLQTTFPLIPLLQDYKDKKFNPIERAENVYSGQWKHSLYTNNEIAEVVIQTDPLTGLFKNFYVTNTNPPSQISLEFRERKSLDSFDSIPEGYKAVEVPTKYKAK